MNTHLQNLLSLIPFDVLWESESLWPDPSESPEVPPINILERYLAKDPFLDPDLKTQIENSVTCLRTLEKLQEYPSYTLDRMDTLMQEKPGFLLQQESHLGPSDLVGKIFTVTSRFRWWDEEQMELRNGYNFEPMHILVVHINLDDDFPFVRAIPCSPEPVWNKEDMLGPQDFLFETQGQSEWVLHSWLSYPVSLNDLYHPVAEVSAEEFLRLRQLVSSPVLESEEEEPEWLRQEREKLLERAQTLCNTLDAYLLQAEAEESLFTLAEEHIIPLPLAAFSQAIVSRVALVTTEDSGVKSTDAVESDVLQAELMEPSPIQDKESEHGFIRWSLSSPLTQVQDVYVINKEKKILGRGEYNAEDHTITLKTRWSQLEPYAEDVDKVADIILLFIL